MRTVKFAHLERSYTHNQRTKRKYSELKELRQRDSNCVSFKPHTILETGRLHPDKLGFRNLHGSFEDSGSCPQLAPKWRLLAVRIARCFCFSDPQPIGTRT